MGDQELGDLVLNTIIEGGLVRADSKGLLVWSGNAQEQIGAAIRNTTPTPSAQGVMSEGELQAWADACEQEYANDTSESVDAGIAIIKRFMEIVLHRAGGRVVTEKLLVEAWRVGEKSHKKAVCSGTKSMSLYKYIRCAILAAIAGKGE